MEVRRQQFEIDLRVQGFERAVRENMFRVIEEMTAFRQEMKEMATLLNGMMDVLKQVTEIGAATAHAIDEFSRKHDRNDAIFDDKDT